MEKRNLSRKQALNLTTIGAFAAAAVIAVITMIMKTSVAEGGWAGFLNALDRMQNYIQNLNGKWEILFAILLLYAVRSVVPIPFPFLIIMTGVMFKPINAVIINTAGFCIVTFITYWFGRYTGGGFALKQLNKYENVRHILLESKNKTKLSVLVAVRIVPAIPINLVSTMYGGMKTPFIRFMIASIIGFAPKIIVYSVMGGNITQPFTWQFMGPVIVLLILTGTVTFSVNKALEKRKGEQKDDESAVA